MMPVWVFEVRRLVNFQAAEAHWTQQLLKKLLRELLRGVADAGDPGLGGVSH